MEQHWLLLCLHCTQPSLSPCVLILPLLDQGHYTQLLANFDTDVNNTASTMLPESRRNHVATAGSRPKPLAAEMSLAHQVVLLFKWEPVLGSQLDPSLDGKFFAFDGELNYNQGSLVETIPNALRQINNQVLV